MYYFSKPTDSTPKAIIVLDGAEVVAEARNAKEKGVKYEFQLYVAGGTMVELYAENQQERQDWLDTLGAVIQAHRRRMHVGGGTGKGALSTGGASGGLYNIDVTGDQAQSSEAFGPGLFGAEAGTSTTFTIQATDQSGQPMTSGGMPFTATLENDSHLYNVQVLDNNDGTYSSTYAISSPGDYSLALKLNDEHHIFGSPFAVRVSPANADNRQCVARGDGLIIAKSMETSYFVIEARDKLGNMRNVGNDPFEGLQDNSDGTYSCAFEVTATADTIAQVPDAVTINVQIGGKHLPGSPFKPRLEPPEGNWEVVDEGKSALPISPVSPKNGRSALTSPMSSPNNKLPVQTGGQPLSPFGKSPTRPKDGGLLSTIIGASYNSNNPSSPMPPAEQSSPPVLAGHGSGAQNHSTKGKLAAARAKAHATQKRKTLLSSKPLSPMNSLKKSPPKANNNLTVETGAGGANAAPSDLNGEEKACWNSALGLMSDPQVLPLFESHSSHLMLVFDYYSGSSGSSNGRSVKTLSLGGSAGTHKGGLQLCLDYDIVPSFLTKKEVRSAYTVVNRMMGGSTDLGLDFGGFIQLLGLLSVMALGKPNFQHMYPSNAKKVGVLLDVWGLADPIRLQMAIGHKN
ncbi:hypothetical protein TL16_g09514 [Triparma laevis f. inornata]|uniref:PH domain-containing protein n=1 Tax=Triparma laevis f. inornata TaxID=1714386 RepID=A0A9W7B3B1_9STRA|nr:hypothetical protein TL16_g09514 [Triparma laevis f. inornata]